MVGAQGLLAATRVSAAARSVALQARPQPRRDQGTRSGVQRNGPVGRTPARKVWRHPLGPRLSPAALPARTVPARHGFPGSRAARFAESVCRVPTCRHFRSTMRRRPRSTTLFRCRHCPVWAGGSASTLRRRRWASRRGRHWTTSRAQGCRRSTCRAARSPCCRIRRARRFHALELGRDCPAVSLYLTVTPEFEISAHESRIEVVPVVANLRHHDLEPLFNEQSIAEGLPDFAFRDELLTLWQLANACEGRRGKPSAMQGQHDYNFRIDGDLGDAEACRVRHLGTQARQPTRQTGCRVDDRRQQHLGRTAGQQGRSPPSIACRPAARCA
jgi:hypothetical protein